MKSEKHITTWSVELSLPGVFDKLKTEVAERKLHVKLIRVTMALAKSNTLFSYYLTTDAALS